MQTTWVDKQNERERRSEQHVGCAAYEDLDLALPRCYALELRNGSNREVSEVRQRHRLAVDATNEICLGGPVEASKP